MRRGLISACVAVLMLVGCSGLEGAAADLQARLEGLDLETALEDLRDCDALSQAFLTVVREAVGRVDDFDGSGEVGTSEMADIVDEVSVSRYYELAEGIGCARLQAQLDLVDQLRGIDADTPAGDLFLDEMLEQAQAGT